MKTYMVPVILLVAAIWPLYPAHAADGATVFKRCAACHLSNGAGVPGAFPPLTEVKALALQAEGRRYLILAVAKGIQGPITVDGKVYRSIMPPQNTLNNQEIADVLNYVVISFGTVKAYPRPFTATEVAAVRSISIKPSDIGALHSKLKTK